MGQGRTAEAIQILAPGGTAPKHRLLMGFLGYAYARAGQRDEAEKLAAGSATPHTQALIFAGLGDKERNLDALDRMAGAVGAQRVGAYLNYPELALLRGDPRLNALRKKIGLPE